MIWIIIDHHHIFEIYRSEWTVVAIFSATQIRNFSYSPTSWMKEKLLYFWIFNGQEKIQLEKCYIPLNKCEYTFRKSVKEQNQLSMKLYLLPSRLKD
jgi:hypothetical protein